MHKYKTSHEKSSYRWVITPLRTARSHSKVSVVMVSSYWHSPRMRVSMDLKIYFESNLKMQHISKFAQLYVLICSSYSDYIPVAIPPPIVIYMRLETNTYTMYYKFIYVERVVFEYDMLQYIDKAKSTYTYK